MPMTFVQLILFLAGIVLLICALDFLLSLIYKNWKLTPWEEEERGRRNSGTAAEG